MAAADIEALDGAQVDEFVLRLIELKPAAFSEQHHFKIHLARQGRVSDLPVFHGLASAGRASQHVPGWIDGFFGGVSYFDGEPHDLADGHVDRGFLARVGEVLKPGGWLGLAYETLGEDTKLLAETRRLLALGAPPIVTPLGLLLHAAGCGYHIRNWYISEGWREGARRLQGYRPAHEESRRRRAALTGQELRSFLAAAADSGELAMACRTAEELLAALPGAG